MPLLPKGQIALILAVVLASAVGFAQAQVTRTALPVKKGADELWQLRLRYGLALRNGSETDVGPGLSYSGMSPNDLAVAGWAWLLFNHGGLTLGAQREAFSLLDGTTAVTSGGLLRLNVGPAGRVRLGPARLEAAASYLFHQLPVFGTVDVPAFSTVQRHGVLLAARALVDLGPVTLEGRFEYPLALAHTGRPVSSQGLGVGGGVRLQLFRTGSLKWGVLADVQWHQDSLSSADSSVTLGARQSVVRAGLGLDLQWKDPALDSAFRPSTLRLAVRSVEGPLPGAALAVQLPSGRRDLTSDPKGEAQLTDLEPGEVIASASLAGYVAGEARVSLGAGEAVVLEVLLKKEPPKVGALKVKVVSVDAQAPLVAALDVNGKAVTTADTGLATVGELAPGPVMVKATAPGFKPGEEAASIVAGKTSELTVVLVPEKKVIPATLSGHVRSARGGQPVKATLEIRELKKVVSADATGAFTAPIPGGKYTIRITAQGFTPQTKTVTVRDGDQAIFNVDLSPK